MKYNDEDLEAIAQGRLSLAQLAHYYGVSRDTLRRSLNRRGYHLRKMKIKITSPYIRKTVYSLQECAETLKVSAPTIRKAIRGGYVKTLEELEIKLEVI